MKRHNLISFNSLLRFISRARLETSRCAGAKAYLAGCVMLGTMTEYLLMAMLRMFPKAVYQRNHRVGEHWVFKNLNAFALECGWFDVETFDAAERIRKNRNLLHPNWYASRKPIRITHHMLTAREADFQKVYDCLVGLVI